MSRSVENAGFGTHPQTLTSSVQAGPWTPLGTLRQECNLGCAMPFSVLFWKPRFTWGPMGPDTHLMRLCGADRTPGSNALTYQLPCDLERIH